MIVMMRSKIDYVLDYHNNDIMSMSTLSLVVVLFCYSVNSEVGVQ